VAGQAAFSGTIPAAYTRVCHDCRTIDKFTTEIPLVSLFGRYASMLFTMREIAPLPELISMVTGGML
jgi:hypothetical protein